MNQTTRMSEPKTRRSQIAADVNQLMSVSSEGLGLIIIKLFLVNTKNINNHSDQALSQNEIAVMYVDCFPRVTWFYHVLRPSSVYFSIRH